MRNRPGGTIDYRSRSRQATARSGLESVALAADRRPRMPALAPPILAILLIVALTGALLILNMQDQHRQARVKLTSDALWVEQYLRFQLQTHVNELIGFAHEIGANPEDLDAIGKRARFIMSFHPEVLGIAWRSYDGTAHLDLAPQTGPPGGDARLGTQARTTGGAVYSTATRQGDDWVVRVVVPVLDAGDSGSTLELSVSLGQFLGSNLPWWITGRYHIAFVDASGTVLAEKSSVQPLDETLTHTISFDPPIPGLYVAVIPYRAGSDFPQIALISAILGLTAVVAINLWIVHRQSQRRAAAEHALRSEYTFRKAMEDSLTIGMRARSLDGTIIYVNPEFSRMVGMQADDLVGLHPPYPYWARENVTESMERVIEQRTSEPISRQFETRFRRPDGSHVDVLVYEAPLIDAAGNHIGWMGSIIDITERKHSEEMRRLEAEQLQRNARLITMGEMASTLAHELNQPLAAISSYATGARNLLESRRAQPGEIDEMLEKAIRQAHRAGTILRGVHDFVRKRTASFSLADLGQATRDAASLSLMGMPSSGKAFLKIDVPDTPVIARIDVVLIEQVVLNLIRNAVEATAGLPDARRAIVVRLVVGDNEAVVSVTDRGNGVLPELADQIYTPFVTSKDDGMGLGLAICRSIVELHRGRLWYETRYGAGAGTTFSLSLPPARPRQEHAGERTTDGGRDDGAYRG